MKSVTNLPGARMRLVGRLFILVLLILPVMSVTAQKEVLCITAKASYYSNKFEGRKCSNGDIFRQNGYTAAHGSLKFGTKVKVINVKNDSSVVVTINDRLPGGGQCRIDLTKAAAKQLNFLKQGIAKVRIEVLKDSVP